LAEAEEALRAIRMGEVDTVVVAGKDGSKVFTLEGEGHAYRMLIESMNEGALTLTANKTILYANECFARMVKDPLEQVTGGPFHRFLSVEDRAVLGSLLKRPRRAGFKMQAKLRVGGGSEIPVNISIRPIANHDSRTGSGDATLSMVVTDMTGAHKSEERLRALTHRVLQVQEEERVRLSHELHDTITQMLCGILIYSKVLAKGLTARDVKSKAAALKLSAMIGATVDEVESISRNLRPSVLDTLGLAAGLQDISAEFCKRTGIPVKEAFVKLAARLSADTELALYRILQETLRNVEKHAKARHVSIRLSTHVDGVRLVIHDDGKGFDSDSGSLPKGKRRAGLGLLGMRERAASVNGRFKIKSTDRGTETEVRVPRLPL
jgi:PAS domain S-box-containing protein